MIGEIRNAAVEMKEGVPFPKRHAFLFDGDGSFVRRYLTEAIRRACCAFCSSSHFLSGAK